MTKDGGKQSARDIAYPALMCALLIGGQFVFSFVAGVEIVTVLLASFSAVFGAKRGALCAVAFSLLRCLLFGFTPSVVLLYLLYYPAFAAVFGGLGHIKKQTFERFPVPFALLLNAVLLGVAAAAAALPLCDLLPVSRLVKGTLYALLWAVFGLCVALCVCFDVLFVLNRKRRRPTAVPMKIILFTSVAAVCTVLFTLLDDVITPLFYGYSYETAVAYFYASFTAMLPQTVCTIVTVGLLFLPITTAMARANRR